MPDSIIKADNISSLSGGGVGFPDGSVSNPSMKFTNDSDTGMYRPNSNELGFVTNGSEKLRIEATGQIKVVYESEIGTDYNTTLHNGYFCRAWVNFIGGSVTNPASSTGIRASGNVSSILDNGTGDYTVNFTIDMPDANYSTIAQTNNADGITPSFSYTISIPTVASGGTYSTSSVRILAGRNRIDSNFAKFDNIVFLAVFR